MTLEDRADELRRRIMPIAGGNEEIIEAFGAVVAEERAGCEDAAELLQFDPSWTPEQGKFALGVVLRISAAIRARGSAVGAAGGGAPATR